MVGRSPRTLTLPQHAHTTMSSGVPRSKPRVLIIEARFYPQISDLLAAGAIAELEAAGIGYERVVVPGALEIPLVLAHAVRTGLTPSDATNARYAGVVALACVIRGETSHYDIVVHNANHWLMDVAVNHAVPLGNGILTVDNEAQGMARAQGGREGKGGDAARACQRLMEIARQCLDQGK